MNLNQNALNQGAAAGALVVVMKLIAYLFGVEAYMSNSVGVGTIVLIIAGMIIACIAQRKAEESFSFRMAFSTAWQGAVVATGIVLIFEVILFGLVDAELAEKVLDFTMDKMQSDMGAIMGIPEGLLEETKSSILWWSGPMGKVLGWLIGLLFWGVVASIVGAVFKRQSTSEIR